MSPGGRVRSHGRGAGMLFVTHLEENNLSVVTLAQHGGRLLRRSELDKQRLVRGGATGC